MSRKASALVLGSFLVAAAIPRSSSAEVRTVQAIAVSSCVNASGTGSLSHDWIGDFNASTTQTLTLDCGPPWIVGNAVIQTVVVEYSDSSSAGDITCSMKLMTWTGLTYFTGSTQTEPNQLLTWHIPNTSDSNLYAYTSCKLPKASSSTQKAGVTSIYVAGS